MYYKKKFRLFMSVVRKIMQVKIQVSQELEKLD